jgi:hypothetical protein
VNGFLLMIVETLVNNVEPIFIDHFDDLSVCQKAAQIGNANDPRMKIPAVVQLGGRYRCFRAESDA